MVKTEWGVIGNLAQQKITSLRNESRERYVKCENLFTDSYYLDQNQTLNGKKRFSYAYPGPILQNIHEKYGLNLLRNHLRRKDLQPTRASYIYYQSYDFNHLHTDAPQCDYTILVCIDGEPQSLYLFPKLSELDGESLLSLAEKEIIFHTKGIELSFIRGAINFIAGRLVPHSRPMTKAPVTMISMCYAGLRQIVWEK